jgi:hypothetical protein
MEILFILSLAVTGIVLTALSIGSVLDDIRKVKRQRRYQLQSPVRRRRTSPLVTILMEVGSDIATTKDAVDNILNGSYRRLEIIILCAPHRQASLRKTIQHIRKNRRPVTVVANKRSPQEAYEQYGRGSIIATLHDTDRLDRRAIEHAVVHLSTPAVAALQPDIVSSIDYSSLKLLQMYSDSLTYFWKKLMNVTTSTATRSPRSFYRADNFSTEYTSPLVGHYFAADVVIYQLASEPHSPTFHTAYEYLDQEFRILWIRSSAAWYRRTVAMCAGLALIVLPVILAYAVYLSIVAHQPLLLFVSLALLTAYLTVGLWSRPGISFRNKICLSILMPVCVLPFYLATFAGAAMTLGILGRTATGSVAGLMAMSKKALSR